ETAPIFVKLMSKRGPYDDIYNTMEYEVFAEEWKRISQKEDDVNTELAFSRQQNESLLAAELRLNAITLDSLQTIVSDEIEKARLEIGRVVVDQWKGSELSKIMSSSLKLRASNNGAAPPHTSVL